MAGATDLAKMVPGFDFLQNLMKNAGAALPAMGQWIAPTLNPEELDKRIQELKTVQFWLEQNARLLATTIQALEVQRMTLSTLQTMNLPLVDLRNALKIRQPPESAPEPARAAAPAPEPPAEPATESAPAAKTGAKGSAAAIDPLQWWSALTQQFTELATQAVKDGAAGAAKNIGAIAAPASGGKARTAAKTSAAKTDANAGVAAAKTAPRKRRA